MAQSNKTEIVPGTVHVPVADVENSQLVPSEQSHASPIMGKNNDSNDKSESKSDEKDECESDGVKSFIISNGFGSFYDIMIANGFDCMTALYQLTEKHLESLGMSLMGQRLKFIGVLQEMKDIQQSSAQQQQAQFGAIDYERFADVIGGAMADGFKKHLRSQVYEHSTSSNSYRDSFGDRVEEYYGATQCMITGAPLDKCVAGHIVPSNVTAVVEQELSENYSESFDKNSARNGLLLLKDVDRAMEQREICFIYNFATSQIVLRSLRKQWDYLNMKPLTYPNNKAVPYRRSLKFHMEQCLEKLSTKQTHSVFSECKSTPWQTLLELSDGASLASKPQHDDDDDDDDGKEEQKNNKQEEPKKNESQFKPNQGKQPTCWKCAKCSLVNAEALLSCRACFAVRYKT